MMDTKKQRGFSLIEILAVLAIIAVLASVILVNAAHTRSVARDGQRASDLGRIQAALALYFADNVRYPATLSSLTATYISQLPVDPFTGASYMYAALDTDSTAATCESFHLGAVMENSGLNVLSQDRDRPSSASLCTGSAADFDGNAANCTGTSAASPDVCYDLAP